jgi:hypothetical protein
MDGSGVLDMDRDISRLSRNMRNGSGTARNVYDRCADGLLPGLHILACPTGK